MKNTQALCKFIDESPTPYHVIANVKDKLTAAGFLELDEQTKWLLSPGGKYFVTRNDTALVAFKMPERLYRGFQIVATHSDQPAFKIKENPEIFAENHYTTLNVETYGGLLCAPWFDRPLSIAGRVIIRSGEALESRLVNLRRDLVSIVNLAIHLNRDINRGHEYKIQKELLPLFAAGKPETTLKKLIALELGVPERQIIADDLFLYNRMAPSIWGAEQEFFSAPRIDDLQCLYASLQALLASRNPDNVAVCAMLDNEEVGSSTKQGALSDFLPIVLKRIAECSQKTTEEHLISLASSFMISADNAHAVHPNYPEKSDPTNRVYLNGGIVIKFSASQRYTTDAVNAAAFEDLCDKLKIPYQKFFNHSDIPGGTTLGNLSAQQLSINTVDIGAPQLAMHSPYETAGVRDTSYLITAMNGFLNG